MTTDSRVVTILSRQDTLEARRSNFDTLFQEIAELILPGEANFRVQRTPGEERTEHQMDGTGSLALRKYAALVESLLMPASKFYHRLKPIAEEIAEDEETKRFLDDTNRLLFRQRYAPRSGFSEQIGGVTLAFGAFGTSSLFLDQHPLGGFRYRAVPLSETYFEEDPTGQINTTHRKWKYTARQAVAYYQGRGTVPKQVEDAVAKTPEREFTFVQSTRPVAEYDGGDWLKRRGFAYADVTICQDTKTIVTESGYRTFPWIIMRDQPIAGEVYGRSPALWSLPTLRLLNAMKRTILRGAQKIVDPPILLQEDGALSGFSLRSGALNYGGIDAQGNAVVQPFNTGARPDIGDELLQREQQLINESFFITLFQILEENPQMTATEVLERAQEKSQLLGPAIGRQQQMLGKMVEREIDLAVEQGLLPEIPPALAEAGAGYEIEYEAPLSRAQRADDGLAIMRTMEHVLVLAQADPSVLDNFEMDEVVRSLSEINGMPAKLRRDLDEIGAIREQRAQQQAALAAAQLAPGVAGAVKDLRAA